MRNPSKIATFLAAGGTVALLLTTSAFADDRHRDETRGNARGGESRGNQNRDSNRGRDFNRGSTDRGSSNRSAQPAPSQRDNGNRGFNGNDNRGYQNRGYQGDRGNTRNDNRGYQADRGSIRNDNRGYNADRGSIRNDNRGYNADRGYTRNDNHSFMGRAEIRSDNRGYRGESSRGYREPYRNGIPRSDGRISTLGRISRYERDRGGYRVWFGGGFPYWVPDSFFVGRRIGVGLDLRLGGIFRNGSVFVDVLGYPGDPYYTDPYYNESAYYGDVATYGAGSYDNGYVTGVVDRVDYRTGTVWLEDSRSGRIISVDMRRVDRRSSRIDFDNLRRGDRVSVSGLWSTDGIFVADRIDSVDAY